MSDQIFQDWCEKNGVCLDFEACKMSVNARAVKDLVEANAVMQEVLSRRQAETAFLLYQRDKAIRALMAIECPTGAPSCPFDMEYLDEQRAKWSDKIGFGCVHKEFDGQCPLEQTESEIFDCWNVWLEGREIG